MDGTAFALVLATVRRDPPTGPQLGTLMRALGGDGIDRLYTLEQVAEVMSCSLKTVYRLLRDRDNPLPCVRHGKGTFVRVKESALTAWMERASGNAPVVPPR